MEERISDIEGTIEEMNHLPKKMLNLKQKNSDTKDS